MSLWFRLVGHVATAALRRYCLPAPLASLVVLVVKMPPGLAFLAGQAFRYPRIIVRILALADLASMLPVVPGPEVPAPRAVRVFACGGPWVWPPCWATVFVGFSHFRGVDWVALDAIALLLLKAVVMILV